MNPVILYENDDLVVIDKPAGITVNKSETTKDQVTVQDWVEDKFSFKSINSDIDKESDFYKRAGIVHRLDKETSGILIIAKSENAFIDLQRQFKERTVKKVYLALSHGNVLPEMGEINVPVGRLPWSRKQFGIIPGGRESKTLYKVINNYLDKPTSEPLSLLELYPMSGRTHQIRVHLKYIGHPVFSDFLYAGRKTARKDRKRLPRVFLHAYKISLIDPETGKSIDLTSPLPDELERFTNSLIS
jgi:23S rRNA pseudouridine1911/1915/1917 synthase